MSPTQAPPISESRASPATAVCWICEPSSASSRSCSCAAVAPAPTASSSSPSLGCGAAFYSTMLCRLSLSQPAIDMPRSKVGSSRHRAVINDVIQHCRVAYSQ